MTAKQSVLILCTGNSCRSQMAEGYLRHFGGSRYEVESAGSLPCRVNETAIHVMEEDGIDISRHRSKHLDEFKDRDFDYVITVCDNARDTCPVYLKAAKKIHWPFPDPPHNETATDEVVAAFRAVRDMIREKFKRAGEAGIEKA